jgi:hypothetical protein
MKEKSVNKNYVQPCVLYDRECIGCMECEMCDLDPKKVCDNCGKCLNIQDDAVIRIDGIELDDNHNKY